jgi:hypothetical protein
MAHAVMAQQGVVSAAVYLVRREMLAAHVMLDTSAARMLQTKHHILHTL